MILKILIFYIICTSTVSVINGKQDYAIFYEDSNFQGESLFVSFSRCANLPIAFNNKISSVDSRNNCFRLWDNECCQGKWIEINSNSQEKYKNLSSADFDDTATSISPCGDYPGESPLFLDEYWHNRTDIVDKIYEDEDTTHYYDITVNRRVDWPQQFIRDAWNYVKKSYGNFGPEGGRLYPIFHAGNERKSLIRNYFEASGYCRNILDLSSPLKNGWNDKKEENMDEILKEMSKFVLTSSNGVYGSPAQSFWDKGNLTDKFAEIFVYDVYNGIGLNEDATRWFNQTFNTTENFPRKEISTYWFRDWFYYIYQKYGQTNAFVNYFSTLAKHFPRNDDFPYAYRGEMNMEEYVHFWSAAVGNNLREVAAKAFGWDVISEYNFIQAQLKYPMKYEGI